MKVHHKSVIAMVVAAVCALPTVGFGQATISQDLRSYLDGKTRLHTTVGVAQAGGIGIQFSLPSDWADRAPNGPGIVLAFSGSAGPGASKVFALTISTLPPLPKGSEGLSERQIADSLYSHQMIVTKVSADPALSLLFDRRVDFDFQPGVSYGIAGTTTASGTKLLLLAFSHEFLYKAKIVAFVLSYFKLASDPLSQEEIEAATSLAYLIGKSIIIRDKYPK